MQDESIENGLASHRRLQRELVRLEALDNRRRRRGWLRRGLRGGLGAGASFWTLVKLKLIGSLGGKLAVAAFVGLGLAWPVVLLVLLAIVAVALAVASIFGGDVPSDVSFDGCDVCDCRRERVKRLNHLIAQRRAWLAAPSEPVPSARRDAAERHRAAKARRP